MQWKAVMTLAMLALVANEARAIPIYMDTSGREWLDLNATRYRSWNDTAAVCDAAGGSCSGILATHDAFSADIDLTGYQWATRDEVRELFYEVAGLPPGSLDDYSAAFTIGEGFGSAAFDIFEPTFQSSMGPGVFNVYHGLTRDFYLGDDLLLRGFNGIVQAPPFGSDTFTLDGGLPVDVREASMGAYLYKAVPEPDVLALFAAGLLAFWCVGASRRRARG